MFATSIEENWSTGRTFHMRSHPLHLPNTAPLRDRILTLCRKLLAKRDPHLASQLIQVLDKGCDLARLGYGGSPSKDFIDAWDIERMKSLAVLEEMSRDFIEPLIHFQIRRTLMRDLRYGKDSPAFRDACRKVLASIPDSLDLRIARTAFGNYYDEFERDTDNGDWQTAAKARWETFIREVADTTHSAHPDAAAWLAHFAALDARWRAFASFNPNFRHLLVALAERRPTEGIAAAEELLAEPAHRLAHTFDAVVLAGTKADAPTRLRLIRVAASATEPLQAAAVACCSWWRRSDALPEEAWQILESLAPVATSVVADRIADFVWLNDKQATLRDWHIVTSLPFAPGETGLAGRIAARAADLVTDSNLKPDADSVARFLRRFEALSEPEGH
jgi:hypothetical protein